ncbi:MAG: tetratricopeptide repeat protein, partial [Candidatus Limnocylindrales bacterium]
LNNWILAGEPSSATDGYLYGATLEVAREIAAVAGQDGLRKVWLAARAGQAAYQPAHGPPNEILAVRATDWRRLLDLLEQETGRSYEAIWRQWVIDPSQDSLLQQRTTTLTAYAAAEQAAGSWNLPPEIRRSLDSWQFDQALTFMSQARGILAQRDQITKEAVSQTTTPPLTLQTAFEGPGIAAASSEAALELSVLNEISAADQARRDSGGAAKDVGLLGADPQADLNAARRAFAGGDLSQASQLAVSARNAWESANSAGQIRIAGSISLLLGGLLLLMLFVWTRGSRLRTAASARVAAAGTAVLAGATAESTDAAGVPADPSTADGETSRATTAAAATVSDDVKVIATGTILDGNHDGIAGIDGTDGTDESAYELLQRGQALLREHHNAQAAVVLERAARIERSKGSILEALGRAYFNSGQHERAAETFEALLAIDPSAHYGHFALGLSFARLGRPQEARTHLRLAVALDPASETYRRALDRMDAAIS